MNNEVFIRQFFILGLLSFYLFFANAEPVNTPPEKPQTNPPVKKPLSEKTKQESKRIRRSGFFDLRLNSTIKFNEAVTYSSTYGFVIEKNWWFISPYTLETQISVGGLVPINSKNFLFSIAARQEWNWIQNDGRNKYIPGASVSFGLDIGSLNFIASMDLGVFYKIFISDHFSLIPEIHFNRKLLDKNTWALSLGLRRYF